MKVGSFIEVIEPGQVELKKTPSEIKLYSCRIDKNYSIATIPFNRQHQLIKQAWNDGRTIGMVLGELVASTGTDAEEYREIIKKENDLGLAPGKTYKMNNQTEVVLKDCFPQEGIDKSILENLQLIKQWVQKCPPHDHPAVIVSGGPSVDFDQVRKVLAENPGAKVICMKHGYPKTLAAGIQPWATVLLDTRPIDGISTIGVLRSKLFERVEQDKKTIFLTATRGNSTITRRLIKADCRVFGWHISTKEINKCFQRYPDRQVPINHNAEEARVELVAANAAVSSIGVLYHLGFRKFHLFGFDGSVEQPEDEHELDDAGERKYYLAEVAGELYWTTGEFVIMALEMENFLTDIADGLDLDFEFYGEHTLMSGLWQMIQKKKRDQLIGGKYSVQKA